MFDIGFSEMIVLAVIALIAIGPKQLPEVARVVGRFINEVRRMTGDFTDTLMSARDSANKLVAETQNQIMSTPGNASPNGKESPLGQVGASGPTSDFPYTPEPAIVKNPPAEIPEPYWEPTNHQEPLPEGYSTGEGGQIEFGFEHALVNEAGPTSQLAMTKKEPKENGE